MKTIDEKISFDVSVKEYNNHRSRLLEVESLLAQERLAKEEALKLERLRILNLHLSTATQNLCRLFSDTTGDQKFLDYLSKLIADRGMVLSDQKGYSGFHIPKARFKITRLKDPPFGVEVESKSLVGKPSDYSVRVSALPLLFANDLRKKQESSARELKDGESNPTKEEILAFCIKRIEPAWLNSSAIRDFRLVIIERTITYDFSDCDFEAYSGGELHKEFNKTLLKLSSPESTYWFFLEKFGLLKV